MSYEDVGKCAICGGEGKFVLEWYGLNQVGKIPIVVGEMGVCDNFRHMVEIMGGDLNLYGSVDRIVDKFNMGNPQLVDLVNSVYDLREGSLEIGEICDEGQKRISGRSLEQLNLF